MAPPASHLLLIRDLGNLKAPESEPFKLEEEVLRVGRSLKCDIKIGGYDCSRLHATLVRQQDERGRSHYIIYDGDYQTGKHSANGTFVNGHAIKRYRLGHGDRILFGSQIEATYWYIPVKPAPNQGEFADTKSN